MNTILTKHGFNIIKNGPLFAVVTTLREPEEKDFIFGSLLKAINWLNQHGGRLK
jgi:hypothetical protein